jgi:CHAT domain-containing protein
MLDFYNSLQRGSSVAASLRVAQLNLIKQGEHPYFWSPFFVIA